MYSEEFDNVGALERNGDDVFSKPVRAGKRTYFFDVKATKGNDYYLTITESKRRVEKDGRFVYDKHKIFLCLFGSPPSPLEYNYACALTRSS